MREWNGQMWFRGGYAYTRAILYSIADMADLLSTSPAGRCKHYICEVEVSTNMRDVKYRNRG
jgi:hypothetical protein